MGWTCKSCNESVLSGPGACPKCGKRLLLYRKSAEKCGHCGSPMEFRPTTGPFSHKKYRDLHLQNPIELLTCTNNKCGDSVLSGYDVTEIDKELEKVVREKETQEGV